MNCPAWQFGGVHDLQTPPLKYCELLHWHWPLARLNPALHWVHGLPGELQTSQLLTVHAAQRISLVSQSTKTNLRLQLASLVALHPLAYCVCGHERQLVQLETTPPSENEPMPQPTATPMSPVRANEAHLGSCCQRLQSIRCTLGQQCNSVYCMVCKYCR